MISLNQSLWLDEAIGAIAVHDYSYLGILHDYIRGDTHPPLYYLTLKLWTDIFGYREVAMRMLSVIFGVLTVYVLYVIAKLKSIEWGGKNINTFPLIAAALLATAPLHIYYSQEVRMYAMNTLLVSLIVLFYIQKDWWKYAISVLLLGMTDYLPLLVLPALFIHALSEKHDLSWWKQFVGSHFPLGVFLLIWFPTFQIQSAGSREALQLFSGWGDLIGRAGVKELSLVWVKFLIGRISFDNKILYGGIVLLMTFCVSYPFIKSIRDVLKTKIWWLWVVVPVMLTFLGAVFIPGFSYFRMIIVLPAFYVLIAYGLSRMGSRALVVIILVANCVFSLEYLINTKHHREDWKGAVSYVEGSPAVPPNQNSVDFWDYGPYCPATYSTAELDWNLNGPVGATCTLYFGQGNGTPVMQNITGDGVYVPQLPGGAGYYHMECTNADGPFSASYTITALQSTDQACTSNPTGTPTGTGQTTVGSNTPNYSVSSNDSGLCFNSSTSVVSWVASAVNGGSFDSCRVLDSNQQIVASGLPTHGTNGPTQPYVYDVPGVGAYTVECQKTGTSGTNASDWVVSANTHTFQACQNNFAFNTSAVALCPGSTATLSWNVGTAVTCTTNSTFTTNQLPPLTQSGSKNGVGPGTYELSCDYSNPNETLYDSITITQLSASQCVLPPTGSGTGPGTTTVGKPGVQEF
jgi:hypothetical protein